MKVSVAVFGVAPRMIAAMWAGIMAVNVAAANAAPAQIEEHWARCRLSDPDVVIAGCSAVIQSGEESREMLAQAFYRRGVAYGAKGKHDHAIDDYDQAIRLKPNYAEAFYMRGVTKSNKGDAAGANADVETAKQLNPDIAR